MAASDVRNALKVNGKICWDPTDLTTAFPHGGTALGLVRGSALRVRTSNHVLRAEEWGGVAVDAVYMAEEYVFACILSGWDTDAVTTLQRDQTAGAATARRVLRSRLQNEDTRVGKLVSTNSGKLYFSPIAAQHPGVLFRCALPMPEESGTWSFNLSEEFGVPMVFLAAPDSTGEPAQVGLIDDLDSLL